MSLAYLEKLNDQQRLAVEHGVALSEGQSGGPLLIIAGAGSGKTNKLAHRVAQLIVNGADPRRILLMTFFPGAVPPKWPVVSSAFANRCFGQIL